MNIGDAAERTGLPAKTIRYYEEIGLTRPARGLNGYRDFSGDEVRKLAFVGRARSLGFSIEDCRSLLSLYEDRARASADVKRIAAGHIAEIGRKIDELEAMRAELGALVARCRGDERPDCPILDDFAGAARPAGARP